MRRVAIAATTLSVAGFAVVLAGPAQAADVPVTASCAGSTLAFSRNYVAAVAGDRIQVENVDASAVLQKSGGSGTGGGALNLGPGNSGSYSVLTSPGTITFTVQAGPSCGGATGTLHFSPTGGGGESGDSTESSGTVSDAPPPVIQEFGKPASGTCADAAPATLNWAGVSSGGWGESWAQWMNGGLGGAVCSRTLVYSQSAEAWTVA